MLRLDGRPGIRCCLSFEGIEDWIPARAAKHCSVRRKAAPIAVERIALSDVPAASNLAEEHVAGRWSPGSPLYRAALAVVVSTAREFTRRRHSWVLGGAWCGPGPMPLHAGDTQDLDTRYFASFGWRYFRFIPCTNRSGIEWLIVVHPTRTRPLDYPRIVPLDNEKLSAASNTRQRNLHRIFKWLADRYGHADPWASSELVRYGPVKSRPSTLGTEFIRDLLSVTGGGKASSFVDIRDYAMIRMLTGGVRREELAQQQASDLSADLIANPFVRVVPLKGAREFTQGRLVPLTRSSAQALTAYLRARRQHKQAKLAALWLGSRNRGP